LGQLKELGVGIDRILNMAGQIRESSIAADEVAKVLGLFVLARLYDGEDASEEHALAMEFLDVLLGCCAPALVCIPIIHTLSLSQLTCFAGTALVALKPTSANLTSGRIVNE
jgi:hypothetical protein